MRTLWADYVFAPEYRLRPLREVETHIAAHGHLPDMPSGAQVEGNGLELGSMMAAQQAKIEELFLHVIALEKRLEELSGQARE